MVLSRPTPLPIKTARSLPDKIQELAIRSPRLFHSLEVVVDWLLRELGPIS